MNKIPVAILGATGLVGQRFITLLANHPWFEIAELAASDNSVGKKYGDAAKWQLPFEIPEHLAQMIALPCDPARVQAPLVFSALPTDIAGELEVAFAKRGAIVSSNASPHRMDADVPLVIPEVNPEHLALAEIQKQKYASNGYIICNGNCTTIHLALGLAPLHKRFGLKKVLVTSMQALSGAGYPGVASLDIIDNVVPYIGGEEEKVEEETVKFLGALKGATSNPGRQAPSSAFIEYAPIRVSAHCNRVATRDGHMETVSVEFAGAADAKPNYADIVAAFDEFRGLPQELGLPLAPNRPTVYRREKDRPQLKLDRDAEKGMATILGRLRECNVMDYKFVLLGHNTLRGAAGATVLNAELLYAQGML
ncbi:MAG: aspartate-semialdehyde dehydrogenase [Chloroflexota bacterium]|nr:MAG: aspartate-semialdehyde dehydrogenase [Chloroflexota bacterium]